MLSYTNNISKNIVLYYDANSSNVAIPEANVYIHKDTRTVQEIKESYYKPYEHTSYNPYKYGFVYMLLFGSMIVLFMLFV
jgi:hypothetical protein